MPRVFADTNVLLLSLDDYDVHEIAWSERLLLESARISS